MGSKIITALIEQRANLKTNPNNLNPEVSRPIEQSPFQKQSSTAPIEQQQVRTNFTGANPLAATSRPLQQELIKRAENIEVTILEQKTVRTSLDGDKTRPIHQVLFSQQSLSGNSGSTKPLEQKNASRAIINGGPIEQVPRISNFINIEQFDFIDLIFPPCNSIRNPVDTNIVVRLRNFGLPLNVDSLVFKVDGLEVQDSPAFTVTALVNGIQIDYNPPENFEYSSQVDIYIQIDDTDVPPNRFIARCSFFTSPDTIGPAVQNFTLCHAVDVEPDVPVELDIVDLETGVNPQSIVLSIEGVEVCDGLTISEINNGFHLKWAHPGSLFRYDSDVSVAVEAEDNASPANKSLFICRFHVRGSSPPEFLNFDPQPCESFVDNTTGLKFEIYGVESGIDISTLEVKIDSQNRKVIVRPRIRRYS